MHQQSECHLAECLWVKASHEEKNQAISQGYGLTWKPRGVEKRVGRRSAAQFIRVVVSKPQSLLMWGSPQGCSRHGSWSTSGERSKREQEKTAKMAVAVFYNLISEVAAHDFCHILLVRSVSLKLAFTQEDRLTQGMNTRRQR